MDTNVNAILDSMKRSTLANYIVPGLSSSLVGGESKGCVRIFEASRSQLADITPHSHRFAFACLVLRGLVVNRVWEQAFDGELFQLSSLTYGGKPGEYTQEPGEPGNWWYTETKYRAGEWYHMTARELHSIEFSADAIVLFFEGPQETERTAILEPFSDGKVIPTFKVEPWMFEKLEP